MLVVVLACGGCFGDETLLTGGATCRGGAGYHCGFDGVPGFADHLYYCPTTATSSTAAIDVGECPAKSCASGANGADACSGGVSRSGAFGYPGYGWWCGEAFAGGVAGHLYFFDDNLGADLGACPMGCVVAATDVADHCR